MKTVYRLVGILCVLLLAAPAFAGEGVLVENIPPGVDKATVLTIVRNALNYREWTVADVPPSAVSGKISRGRVDAQIRISLVDNSLRYQESAITTELSTRVRKVATPSRWIEYLRSDISEELQARAKARPEAAKAASKDAPQARGSTLQRMQELKQLQEAGLISNDEYERKRAEILDGL